MQLDMKTIVGLLTDLGLGVGGGGLGTNSVNENTRALEIQAEQKRFEAQIDAHQAQLERTSKSYAMSLEIISRHMRTVCP